MLQPIAETEPQIRPGDQLRVNVWRAPEYSGVFFVTANGTLEHPLYQNVSVTGAGLAMVKDRLRDLLVTYIQNPQLEVELLHAISVGGAVGQPTLLRLPRGTTFADAIAQAGGATDRGRLDRVRVIRANREMILDLSSPNGNFGRIPVISGDQLFVGYRSNFNFVRDVFLPILNLGTLAISIANLVTN